MSAVAVTAFLVGRSGGSGSDGRAGEQPEGLDEVVGTYLTLGSTGLGEIYAQTIEVRPDGRWVESNGEAGIWELTENELWVDFGLLTQVYPLGRYNGRTTFTNELTGARYIKTECASNQDYECLQAFIVEDAPVGGSGY